MKVEVWTQHGPLNSKAIFKAFITSLQDAGDDVILNASSDADVAVIWSVLWQGRMRNYKKIWERYRQAKHPDVQIYRQNDSKTVFNRTQNISLTYEDDI